MNLVTGGTGLVGTRILFDLLKKGQPVRATRRKNSDTESTKKAFEFYDQNKGSELFKKIEWVNADLLDVSALNAAIAGADHVYHTAGMVSYQRKDYDKLLLINQEGTENVVNISLENGVKKLCHVSSIAALGVPKTPGHIDETAEWKTNKNTSNYGLSKFLGEREIWRGIAEGLDAVIVNPSLILAPGKINQSSGAFMHFLRKGINYYPSGQSGFIGVEDVSQASISLMESSVSGERFILNSQNMSYKEILDLSAEILQNKKPSVSIPKWVLSIAGAIVGFSSSISGTKAQITRETIQSSYSKKSYDNSKIKETTGINFRPIAEVLEDYLSFLP